MTCPAFPCTPPASLLQSLGGRPAGQEKTLTPPKEAMYPSFLARTQPSSGQIANEQKDSGVAEGCERECPSVGPGTSEGGVSRSCKEAFCPEIRSEGRRWSCRHQ